MATLYFSNTVDYDWATLGNWWTSAAFTTQASALPASSDSVVLDGIAASNSGSAPTVVNLTVNAMGFNIAVTVTGVATFNNSTNSNTITGNATFNGSSTNDYATINGNATFNDTSSNFFGGTINGNATFNDYSANGTMGDATVEGDATFNDFSYNSYYGIVNGDATFRGSAYNRSGLNGGVILAYEKGINGSSILGVV
jgi:hypothetical protein